MEWIGRAVQKSPLARQGGRLCFLAVGKRAGCAEGFMSVEPGDFLVGTHELMICGMSLCCLWPRPPPPTVRVMYSWEELGQAGHGVLLLQGEAS